MGNTRTYSDRLKKGRPTKLNRKLTQDIATAIRAGSYMETAAGTYGITAETARNWLSRGRDEKRGLYRSFFLAVTKAWHESTLVDVVNISEAAQRDWKASAWRLERKTPELWGKREVHRLEHTGANGGPIEVSQQMDLSKLSDQELAMLETLVEKATVINVEETKQLADGDQHQDAE